MRARWRATCGSALEELGVADHADLLGYVPITDGLLDVYRSSHAFLHVSWTEGLPQTLFEAFAAGLPVVATAVGGVPDAVGDCRAAGRAGRRRRRPPSSSSASRTTRRCAVT